MILMPVFSRSSMRLFLNFFTRTIVLGGLGEYRKSIPVDFRYCGLTIF